MGAEGERAEVAAFRAALGLESLIDVHTHFMPERVMAKVWAYFDAAGPLVGRRWPIAYRLEEERRLEVLRGFGVTAFTSMVYPHKPGMARWLNDWAADFAARTPDCLHTATFFAEPSAPRTSRAPSARARGCSSAISRWAVTTPTTRCSTRCGVCWPTAACRWWCTAGRARCPVRSPGPGPIAALLARHPRLRLVVAHLGMPEYEDFLALAERHERVLLDTTMAFTPFVETAAPFPRAALPRLADLGDRVLLGTDFPNIPYRYADALGALERTGLGTEWLRAVCHDNAARLFAQPTPV